jgi:hypothetical protein
VNISDITEPSPSYGIGIEALVEIWIAREQRLLSKGDTMIAGIVHMMRREIQEACDLVVDPETLKGE